MSIEQEIAVLTQSTTDLLDAVNTQKVTLDTAVSDAQTAVSSAQTAVTDATSQVSLAAAEKVGAQTARDTAETFKDQAYTYSQSAASAVAYQDLTAIAQTKSESAVDVFVYDTSKDSDGGAWRKRTQGTSWYNETLNTATRGGRKEFPAVAVIVAEASKVTIYDGDDPDMPMWAVFSFGWDKSYEAVHALNGKIAVANFRVTRYSGNGLYVLDFCVDKLLADTTLMTISNIVSGTTQGLVTTKEYISGDGIRPYSSLLVNYDVKDVAMTVLPDAPIDPATGLPIPTIAVATEGGVSVIKDDGSVVDITTTAGNIWDAVSFSDKNRLIAYHTSVKDIVTLSIPSTDYNYIIDSDHAEYRESSIPPLFNTGSYSSSSKNLIPTTGDGKIFISRRETYSLGEGFSSLLEDTAVQENGMVNYITSDYNTGWMNGDIKLATLSDTDDTDLVGSELVTNGTFDTDLTGWTDNSINGGSVAYSSGTAELTAVAAGIGGQLHQYVTTVVGRRYRLTVDRPSGTVIVQAPGFQSDNGTGTVVREFVATSTTSRVNVLRFNAGTGVVDNISVKLAEPDRSVNNNGLQVFGTVQKSPVATGADLVAYSGFSSTNYLEQPYNSDLDFGTGDFCVMGWVSRLAGDMTILYTGTTQVDGINIWGYNEVLKIRVGGAPLDVGHNTGDGFSFIIVMRKSGVVYIYINGALKASVSAPNTINYNGFKVGTGFFATSFSGFKLALLRISATAPTAEQIAKIYRDEKVLFQENAKATLYGTSDAVTALAYDTDTELLHVGTSSGRSVFQGLQRVDNTTDAVGTAISAINNLVVEE